MIFRTCEVAGSGAKENFWGGETDLVALCGEGDVHFYQNNRR